MTLYRHNAETIETTVVDFGFVDQKGRKVGYRCIFQKITMTALPADARSGYCLRDGLNPEHFQVTTSPTRNGEGYGPAFNRFAANTLEECKAVAAKRTEAARKSNLKKFGGAQ